MNDLLALRVRGWTTSDSPGALIDAALGASALSREVRPPVDEWWVADPLPPREAIGPIRSLLVAALDGESEIEIVPGSMGLPRPAENLGHAVVRPVRGAARALLFDARCWWRVRHPHAMTCSVWVRVPEVPSHG